MAWHDDDNHPFAGILAKLERADESVHNLHTEILSFFEKSKYPIIPDTNDERWQDSVDYHKQLVIPKRFSVLVGEIVHHLRSCLDHIVWIFSDETSRRLHENAIQFPIFSEALNKKTLASFERNIQGVTKPSVRKLIFDFQPYQRGSGALDHPLCIIHDMDRFDKHRELAIVNGCANLTFPSSTSAGLLAKIMSYEKREAFTSDDIAAIQRAVKHDAKVTPQIAFANFGNGQRQFVVPAVEYLLNSTIKVVNRFADEV
jgi:hypothetical protein